MQREREIQRERYTERERLISSGGPCDVFPLDTSRLSGLGAGDGIIRMCMNTKVLMIDGLKRSLGQVTSNVMHVASSL